ncbi:MAG: helix-turn-helix transcriptional regulator [Gemmatimonadales bacterium]
MNILPLKEVQFRTGGKSRTTLWRDVRAGRFPAPVKVGPNRIGWLESEIEDWQENLPRVWRPQPGREAA